MTSEVDALKTNEFLRRRKLRIQQVREQSKDIAKKIRQRASSEKFRQLINIDKTKERAYLEQQDKLIKKLEQLHAKSVGYFGASHKKAAEATQEENKQEKVDLSKQRAREATAELRRQKQEKLDEQKKLLDRKLQAREIANGISREKSSSVANKLSKSSVKDTEEAETSTKPATVPGKTTLEQTTNENDNEKITTNDMATQWDFESWPNEWEPNVPSLSLPKDDTPIEPTSRSTENHETKSKRPNLFAVSEEMPSSLRGGLTKLPENTKSLKPSLTLVSDYIQNRDLRLRNFDSKSSKRTTGDFDPKPSKKSTEDLQKLKQTIIRSRTSKAEGSNINSVHVADGQVVPVPSWQPETGCCGHCSHDLVQLKHNPESRQFNSITNSQINSIYSSIRPRPDLQPTPVLRESSPFKRNKVWPGTFSAKSTKSEKPTKPEILENVLGKKSSVTMYNHSTRNVRDVPYADQRLVSRDHQANEDAYSQAMKETSSEQTAKDKDHQKRLQNMRSKIAVTKQSVEKEYKDTMAFLNSLPKEKTKPLKNAYKDAYQEQIQLEHRQRKLQHEFRKIQKECRKQAHLTPRPVDKVKLARIQNSDDEEDDFESKDLQYSWMPVPESDQGLAVHIIPTKTKDQKAGNSVKFSKIDSYHEYRSRHKHTPPTKDTSANERQKNIEAEFIEEQDMDISTSSTIADASSVDDLSLGKDKKGTNSDKESDTERIIIYKILDTKSSKKKKKHSRCTISKPLSFVNRDDKNEIENGVECSVKRDDAIHLLANENKKTADNESCLFSKQLKEGIYKTISKKGDNISSVGLTDEQKQKSPSPEEAHNVNKTLQNAGGRNSDCISKETIASQPANSGSCSSFKTAATNNRTTVQQQFQTTKDEASGLPPGGYVKVVDQNGQESGKFFIGATGFLKDDAYEVTIKLRKTDTTKTDKKDATDNSKENVTTVNQKCDTPVLVEPEKIHATTITDVEEKDKTVNLDVNVQATSQTRCNLVDKGIDVPSENSFVNKQPGNSVSVQTTLDSPDIRYHRMSSSTSTAYMSPPEVILPRYLRHDEYMENSHFDSSRNPKVYMVNHEPRLYPKRTSPRPKPNLLSPTKRVLRGKTLNTPPNTARNVYSPCTRKNVPITVKVPKAGKKNCHKRICSKTCQKYHLQKTKGALSSNIMLAPPPSVNNTNAQNSRTDGLNVGKQDLNPLVKQYVDKLLHMNKEGIKAINVENQDCSSVATPGSSIIDDPNNINKNECKIEPKISLEQIKQLIAQHVVKKIAENLEDHEHQETIGDTGPKVNSVKKPFCFSKKRSIHKVKSLNISRSLLSRRSFTRQKPISNAQSSCPVSRASPTTENYEIMSDVPVKQKHRSRSSPSPRRLEIADNKMKPKTNSFEVNNDNNSITESDINKEKSKDQVQPLANNKNSGSELKAVPSHSRGHECVVSSWNYDYSSDSTHKNPTLSLHSSTQTNRNIDEQIIYMKMAEDKLQNMEKIADLTEKCTQRLSNLAKVLEEVRKNKLSYSHASESASDTDQVSGKNSDSIPSTTIYEPIVEIKQKVTFSPPSSEPTHSPVTVTPTSPPVKPDKELEKTVIDKIKKQSPPLKKPKSPGSLAKTCYVRSPIGVNTEHHPLKSRGKPPPALMRRCLKRTQEYVVPHELSTVVEIDSPISTKYNKSQSAQQNTKCEASIDARSEKEEERKDNAPIVEEVSNNNPDLLDTNFAKQTQFIAQEDPAEDSKIQMMDLKQFNDIMLQPFISIQEYAKQCNNITKLEDGSNIETLLRGDVITDELSSLHSDGSLPDVIAELLRRNIISEPFKFDTASNLNSTTVSSDSTLSVLALSKVKKGKKRIRSPFSIKDNLEESSDTLSASSNPDLEKAFKKLGMGWASSTLKKTKEHLALSSSSTNSSSSSLTQFKLRTIHSKDFPVLVTDSMSSIRNATNIMTGRNDPSVSEKPINDDGKKATSQQTSVANSVKQFLTNELAKRITFGDRSHTKDTEEEFVSLCETKMPEEMQRTPNHEDRSIDSNPRARTSTPVQIFKSMTYHSSSSSNVSNGLFSNADDLSSVKGTSNSMRNRSTSEKDELTIPNFSLRKKKGLSSDYSRSDD